MTRSRRRARKIPRSRPTGTACRAGSGHHLPTASAEVEKIIQSASAGVAMTSRLDPPYYQPWATRRSPSCAAQLKRVDDIKFFSAAEEKAVLKERT